MPLHAQETAAPAELPAMGVSVEWGTTPWDSWGPDTFTLGIQWHWTSSNFWAFWADEIYAEGFVSRWQVQQRSGAHEGFTQEGVTLNWRYRLSRGEGLWFIDVGLGATVMNPVFHSPSRRFSTAFQFTEAVGLGYSFGAQRQHEVSLRYQHFSNADMDRPNPGEDFVRLRYAYRFWSGW